MSVSVSLSPFLPVDLFASKFLYVCVVRFVCLSAYLHVFLSFVFLSVFVSVYVFLCVSACVSVLTLIRLVLVHIWHGVGIIEMI